MFGCSCDLKVIPEGLRRQYCIMAWILCQFISMQISIESGLEVMMNVLKMIIICQTNASTVIQKENAIASGLYPDLSLMNHSCLSNVFT